MPNGGTLTIETANASLDDAAARVRSVPRGQFVVLSVSDTGVGMSAETMSRVFEPFFTTKPTGEGTGLGLSMVRGFARQSGGEVRLYSEVGQGTTAKIYLPRSFGDEEELNIDTEAPHAPVSASGHTVLFVDDEPAIRSLAGEMLQEMGYTFIEAADAAAALKILETGAKIDLLITDIGLTGSMNGRRLAEAARVLRPDLNVLFITGFGENAVLGNGTLGPGMQVMTKPFSFDAFAGRIRELVTAGIE
jgi:CheY-like chemotaxis protein